VIVGYVRGDNNGAEAHSITNLNHVQESSIWKNEVERFMIVLNIWARNPFAKGETKGSMILVATQFRRIAEMVMRGANQQVNLHGLLSNAF
jgi:hypothetical protein